MFPKNPPAVLLHILGWMLFFGLMISFVASGPDGFDVSLIFPHYLVFIVAYMGLFYLNSLLLIPKLYLKKKHLLYFIIILILLVGFYFLQPFDHLHSHTRPHDVEGFRGNGPHRGEGRHGPKIDIISLVLFVMVLSFSAALEIIKQWRITEQRAIRAETDKATAELSFLKAQINPHFLFNTLNNIYSMAVSKSEKTADSVLKLSNIMRYVTDEVGQDFVPLESEVDCASDYIDLQKMRLSDRATVIYTISGNLQGKKIAPMLLMTFIENVFKYGISNHEPSTITIKLMADDGVITFTTENKLYDNSKKIERTGIGITNAKQRLEHLYAGKHLLNITSADGLYKVHLVLTT